MFADAVGALSRVLGRIAVFPGGGSLGFPNGGSYFSGVGVFNYYEVRQALPLGGSVAFEEGADVVLVVPQALFVDG